MSDAAAPAPAADNKEAPKDAAADDGAIIKGIEIQGDVNLHLYIWVILCFYFPFMAVFFKEKKITILVIIAVVGQFFFFGWLVAVWRVFLKKDANAVEVKV